MDTVLVFGGDETDLASISSLLRLHQLHGSVQVLNLPSGEFQAAEGENVVLVVAYYAVDAAGTLEGGLNKMREKVPDLPFIVAGKTSDRETAEHWLRIGADDYFDAQETWRLIPALRRALRGAVTRSNLRRSEIRGQQMIRLLTAVQDLSLAKDVPTVQMIVRRAARDLTGADGATFVLKEGDYCYYADEDAIGPLWKGQRFPLTACISGWVMGHKEPVVINDIYLDERIPWEAYRSTFVKSLLMVPIRANNPIGAIGNYWAERRQATPEEIELLQALANTTAVAMENVQVYAELENRVRDRTRLLEQTNRELETFSYSVSHDLRSPITSILGFAQLLSETIEEGRPEEVRNFCDRIITHAHRMSGLIRDLLRLAKVAQTELKFQSVDLSSLASQALARFRENDPTRLVCIVVSEKLMARADPELAEIVLENLLSNAWKYTGKVAEPTIEFGGENVPENGFVFFVRDNGAGFEAEDAKRLFAPFQRLHDEKQFAGVGLGLATVQRIVHKHGGRIWAEGAVGKGATFYFTLPNSIPTFDCSRAA